jgi:hypothetical protein
MKPHLKLVLGVTLASAMLFAQSQSEVPSYTYTGDIVNANCYLATRIVNRNSRGYTPVRGASAFNNASRETVPNATPRQKKSILRHCSINPGTTAFALLNDEGNFLKLNDKGNLEVMSQTTPQKASTRSGAREIKVLVTGSVDGDTLVVQSVSKR